jgi:hypothetical protein
MKKCILIILNIALIAMLSACDFVNTALVPNQTITNSLLNPMFSHASGYYESSIELDLISAPNTIIYYTLDGSLPTQEDFKWTGPITIDERMIPEGQDVQIIDDISDIPTQPISWIRSSADKWSEPSGEIFSGTVVKAIAFDAQGHRSEVVTHTYFVSPDMFAKYTLPIISLSTDIQHLYDYQTGINIAGQAYDPTIPQTTSNRTGNYFESGQDWERPVTVEMFSNRGMLLIQQEAGLRVHGGLSRKYPIKSYRLYARSEYDDQSSFDYPFFEDRELSKYKRIILRAGGQAYEYTFMGEAAAQMILRPLNLDIQYSTPVILFINGEYFGIRNIRDRYDTWYLENLYGIRRNQSTILTGHAYVEDGSQIGAANYMSVYRYATTKNMSVMRNYRHIEKQMDVDNFIDYYIAQLYFANKDWPQNNILYWKKNVSYNPNAPEGHDGRWRWMVYDVDAGFAASWGGNTPNINSYETLKGDTWKTGKLFVSLLRNPEFRSKYMYRMETLLSSTLSPEITLDLIEEMESIYAPEMQEHIDRWGYPTTYETWQYYVNRMKTFALERPAYLSDFTQQFLGIDGQLDIRVIHNNTQGSVKVHDHLDSPGILNIDAYQDLELVVEATSRKGYRFKGWYDESDSLVSKDHQTLVMPREGLVLEARFEPGIEFTWLKISDDFLFLIQMGIGLAFVTLSLSVMNRQMTLLALKKQESKSSPLKTNTFKS